MSNWHLNRCSRLLILALILQAAAAIPEAYAHRKHNPKQRKPGQNCAISVEVPAVLWQGNRKHTWYTHANDAAECEAIADSHRFERDGKPLNGRKVTSRFGGQK